MPPVADPRVEDCVAYGYSILVPRPRPDWARKELPERIISQSNCLKTDLTDVWLDAWREREGDMESVYRDAHDHFGLDREAVNKLCLWYQTKPEVEMHAFTTVSAAREAVRELLPRPSNVEIVGVGLPRAYVSEVLTGDTSGPVDDAYAGISQLVLDALQRDQPLAPDGTALGFEPIVLNRGLSCSWLCNGIDRDADDKLGIKTNGFGLIERLEDADRVVRYIREDGRAEPGLWLPWLLVRY
jgi:hypothetical protein